MWDHKQNKHGASKIIDTFATYQPSCGEEEGVQRCASGWGSGWASCSLAAQDNRAKAFGPEAQQQNRRQKIKPNKDKPKNRRQKIKTNKDKPKNRRQKIKSK